MTDHGEPIDPYDEALAGWMAAYRAAAQRVVVDEAAIPEVLHVHDDVFRRLSVAVVESCGGGLAIELGGTWRLSAVDARRLMGVLGHFVEYID